MKRKKDAYEQFNVALKNEDDIEEEVSQDLTELEKEHFQEDEIN